MGKKEKNRKKSQKEAMVLKEKGSDDFVPELTAVRKKRKAKKERQRAKKAAAKEKQALEKKAAAKEKAEEKQALVEEPKKEPTATSATSTNSAIKSGKAKDGKMALMGAGEITATMSQGEKKAVWAKFWAQAKQGKSGRGR